MVVELATRPRSRRREKERSRMRPCWDVAWPRKTNFGNSFDPIQVESALIMALTLKASDVPGVLAALEREIDDAKTEAQSAVHVFQEAESIDMRSGDDMQEKLSSLKASLKDVVDWSQSDAGLAIIATRAQKERDGLDQRLQGLNASISLVEVICDLDACFDTMDSAVEVS